MMTTPWTRADWAIGGYTGLTSFVLTGCLIAPPTRTGAVGGGGGGGASGRPPTTPPIVPPGIPPSTPPGTPSLEEATVGTSGTISLGASTGAAFGFWTGTGCTFGAAAAGGRGGGGGGGGGAPTNAIIVGGVGRTSVAISGMMMTAANRNTCAAIESGTVYHFCEPSLIS